MIIAVLMVVLLGEVIGTAYNSYFISAWISCYILGFFMPDIERGLSKRTQTTAIFLLIIVSTGLNIFKLRIRYVILPESSGIKELLCTYFINYSRIVFALTIFFSKDRGEIFVKKRAI